MSNPNLVRKVIDNPNGEAGEVQSSEIKTLADSRIASSKNLIINSNLEFWQRGTNFTGLGANQVYTADRFQWAGGTLTATLSGTRVAITGANSSIVPTRNIPWAIRYGVSVAQPSLAAGASAAPWMKIEGYDIVPLAQAGNAGFTFSFYTRAFRPGAYSVQFANGAITRSYATTFTIVAADTWQRVVIKVPFLDVGNGVWNFTNGIGMYIRIWMAAGVDNVGVTPDVWGTNVGPQIPNTQVNAVQSTSDYLELTGLMLHTGQEERDFATRESYVQELQLCQRYYEKSYPLDTLPGTVVAVNLAKATAGDSGGSHFVYEAFLTPKRAVPAVNVYNGATGTISQWQVVSSGFNGNAAVNTSADQMRAQFQGFSYNVNASARASYHYTADAEL